MPEWLVEKGIGESRAALIEDGQIVEARIELEATIPAGTVIKARLVDIGVERRNGIAQTKGGTEYLLPHVPRVLTQGQELCIEVTRTRIPGPEPWKRPMGKATRHEPTRGPSLAGRLRKAGKQVRELMIPAAVDELAQVGWNDLMDEARACHGDFAGGSLDLFPTPAMTLIDVDGHLAPDELAVAGASAAARVIRRFDIGGSIGIDLPTAAGKNARQCAAEAIDTALPQPFERTAVNGFGFVQIVRPRRRPSLIELAQDRAAFEARALLRRVAFEPAGSKTLIASPGLIEIFQEHGEWLASLSTQVGGSIGLRADPALPMSGGYAENA